MIDFTKKIVNSDKFRTPAITYIRNGGKYTLAPRGTREYQDYWETEMDRCLNGYTAYDGDYITGYHYFYLNYSIIELSEYKEVYTINGEKIQKSLRFKKFPKFFDYDYYFFLSVEEAENLGKHMCVLKARRKGYSYKVGSMMCRNFFLIPGSKSYAYASDTQYLDKDGILTKAWEIMSFVDENTAWGKKRDVVDRGLHKRASFVVKDNLGNKIESGYKSEIIGVSIGKDPDKVRGKAGKLIAFEESGKLPELEAAWQIARPSVESSGQAFGLMIAFGTGGGDDNDFATLKDMFYNPESETYNCLGFDNIWDEGVPNKKCGFFVPFYANLEIIDEDLGNRLYMDDDGNTITGDAIRYCIDQRKDMIHNATSTTQIDRYMAENPMTPQEACLELGSNLFPKKELQDHLSYIRTHEKVQAHKQVGDLEWGPDGNLVWTSKPNGDLRTYKLAKDANKKGAIVVWEHPVPNPAFGLYILGCDPYDHDTSTTDSLGSCIVWKRFQGFEEYYDMPVAEYTGRPDRSEDFYETVRKLALYYNGTVMYENQNKGMFSYFKNKYCDYLLADQPDIIKDIIHNSSVERIKGIHMTEEIKNWGETTIRDWLNEEYAPGKKNLTKIFSEPLLEELISFNRKKGNYDRVMALITLMIYRVQLHNMHIKQGEKAERKRKFREEPLFKYL